MLYDFHANATSFFKGADDDKNSSYLESLMSEFSNYFQEAPIDSGTGSGTGSGPTTTSSINDDNKEDESGTILTYCKFSSRLLYTILFILSMFILY